MFRYYFTIKFTSVIHDRITLSVLYCFQKQFSGSSLEFRYSNSRTFVLGHRCAHLLCSIVWVYNDSYCVYTAHGLLLTATLLVIKSINALALQALIQRHRHPTHVNVIDSLTFTSVLVLCVTFPEVLKYKRLEKI